MIDLTPIVNGVIALSCALVVAFFIPWLRSRCSNEEMDEILKWVKIAVTAAEQIFKGTGTGLQKKRYVLEFLADNGYFLNEDEIEVAIEAAVKELNMEMGK